MGYRSATFHNDAPNGFRYRHDLINAQAALIAVRALTTADGPEYSDSIFDIRRLKPFLFQSLRRDINRLLAVRAKLPGQSLGNNEAY